MKQLSQPSRSAALTPVQDYVLSTPTPRPDQPASRPRPDEFLADFDLEATVILILSLNNGEGSGPVALPATLSGPALTWVRTGQWPNPPGFVSDQGTA